MGADSFFEMEPGVSATIRNWQTTRRLLELAQALAVNPTFEFPETMVL
jgi:hypothetical protein